MTKPQWALERIRKAKEHDLTNLDLESESLTRIPDEITELPNLEMLNLGSVKYIV